MHSSEVPLYWGTTSAAGEFHYPPRNDAERTMLRNTVQHIEHMLAMNFVTIGDGIVQNCKDGEQVVHYAVNHLRATPIIEIESMMHGKVKFFRKLRLEEITRLEESGVKLVPPKDPRFFNMDRSTESSGPYSPGPQKT